MSAEALLSALAEELAPLIAEKIKASRDEPLTIQEAAEYLRVSPAYVRKLIRAGQLVAADVGSGQEKRLLRLMRRELDRFVEMRKGVR